MKKRLIALTNGTGMGGELIVFSTNAPKERLQALEKESCDVFLNGGDMEDVPLWCQEPMTKVTGLCLTSSGFTNE